MRELPRRISIGTRLALQYGLALLASLVFFALLVEAQVERRISHEAQLVLRIQLVDLVDDFGERKAAAGWTEAEAWFAHHASLIAASADPSIGLGVQLLRADGSSAVAVGSLAGAEVPVDRDLLQGRRSQSYRAVNLGREHAYLTLTQRVGDGLIRVAVDTSRFSRNVEDIRRIFLVSIPLVLLVSSGAGFLLSRRAMHPISRINRVARRITSQRLHASIPTTGSGDELDELAETLNAMIERIQSGVLRLERFSANIAHELRSPLNRIRNRIEELGQHTLLASEQRVALDALRAEVETMSREIEAMLRLARFEQGLSPEQRQPIDLAELVRTVVDFFEPEAQARDLGIEFDLRAGPKVEGDEVWLRMMASNLVSNALKYSDAAGRIRVRLDQQGGVARITFSNSGEGIPAERLASIFERFERGPGGRREQGFGLGLPIAREIARAHGGDIGVSSQVGHGATFVVTLPVSD